MNNTEQVTQNSIIPGELKYKRFAFWFFISVVIVGIGVALGYLFSKVDPVTVSVRDPEAIARSINSGILAELSREDYNGELNVNRFVLERLLPDLNETAFTMELGNYGFEQDIKITINGVYLSNEEGVSLQGNVSFVVVNLSTNENEFDVEGNFIYLGNTLYLSPTWFVGETVDDFAEVLGGSEWLMIEDVDLVRLFSDVAGIDLLATVDNADASTLADDFKESGYLQMPEKADSIEISETSIECMETLLAPKDALVGTLKICSLAGKQPTHLSLTLNSPSGSQVISLQTTGVVDVTHPSIPLDPKDVSELL